jgi:short-subunit dehydrogenase
MQVTGKKFLVTGAGNGMGREVALELLRRGAIVIGVDLNKEFLTETKLLATDNSERFSIEALDVTDRKNVAALAAKHPDLDGLVNVAGIIQPFVKVQDLEFEAIEKVMNVNFFGVVNLVKAFLPGLLKRPEANILNVSSMGSYAPVPGQTLYGASKAALNLFTEGLRSELSETNVSLTLVWPGAIGTNIAANSGIQMSAESTENAPKMKVTTALDAGAAIVNAIEQGKKRLYVGSDAKFMGGLAQFSIDSAAKLIYKNLKHLLPQSA